MSIRQHTWEEFWYGAADPCLEGEEQQEYADWVRDMMREDMLIERDQRDVDIQEQSGERP